MSPKPRRQCKKCPWKVGVDPHDIPNGYSEQLHRGLAETIAKPGAFEPGGRIMACHESPSGEPIHCVGWLHNQLGTGNNIPLRLAVISGKIDANYETVGPQHESFEDTLPRGRREVEL